MRETMKKHDKDDKEGTPFDGGDIIFWSIVIPAFLIWVYGFLFGF